jgi:hypothetical protein
MMLAQTVLLGLLAALIFGSAVFFAYRFLGWLLD